MKYFKKSLGQNFLIDKKLLNKKETGVTEFLASMCKIKKKSGVMVIMNNNLIVSPITNHLDIRSIAKNINKDLIVNKVKIINNWFKKSFIKKPKIGILGLNPHNAEFRMDSEENRIIRPAIKKLIKYGIKVKGPLVSDTLFINNYKNFDVIVGMYHDQVLAPMKSLFKYNAINITLGLKYLRVSPDHGVSLNLIGKNKANPTSLIECIKFLNKFK